MYEHIKLTEDEKKIGQRLVEAELLAIRGSDDIEFGTVVYLYNSIANDRFEKEYSLGLWYENSFYGCIHLKMFRTKEDRDRYADVNEEFQNLISKKLLKETMKMFDSFADVDNIGLGESMSLVTNCVEPSDIHVGYTPKVDPTEYDRVMGHYRGYVDYDMKKVLPKKLAVCKPPVD